MKTNHLKLTALLIGALCVPGCGHKDDKGSDTAGQTGTAGATSATGGWVSGNAKPLYIRVAQTSGSADAALGLADPDPSAFRNGAIASGPVDEMHLLVKRIALAPRGGGLAVPVFADQKGKEIVVKSDNSVDLSQLFTKVACMDQNGGIVDVPAGKTCECGLDAKGKLIDKVQSIVNGNAVGPYICPAIPKGGTPPVGVAPVDQTGTYSSISITFASGAKVKGCVIGIFRDDDAKHTYCTQAGIDPYGKDVLSNAQFEDKKAELMSFNFGNGKSATDDIEVAFPIAGGFTIDNTSSPTITLLVDTGRMLRYYNGFASGSANPGARAKGTSWFGQMPQTALYGFLGHPGTVEGYAWTALSTDGGIDLSAAPVNHACTSKCYTINGWLTLVKDVKGAPLLASFMPDDDNTLTVIKGANFGVGGLDQQSIVKANGLYTLKYNLGADFYGHVYDLNLGLDVGATQETYFTNEKGNPAYGQVQLTRKY